MRGRYPIAAKPGLSPLSDAAGEIVEIGEDVRRFSIGDRVVNSCVHDGSAARFAIGRCNFRRRSTAGCRPYRVISAESLSRMPEHMSFEEGATLPCSGVTAWSALSGIGAVDTVLTQGSGGVSLFAIQLARLCGARVIATTTTADVLFVSGRPPASSAETGFELSALMDWQSQTDLCEWNSERMSSFELSSPTFIK